MMRLLGSFLFGILACSSLCAQREPQCPDKSGTVTKDFRGFTITLDPANPKQTKATWDDWEGCRAIVRNKNKKVIFTAVDDVFSIVQLGEDVNGDGEPDVVLEGYGGGAHCCWTYYIVSLGTKPGLVRSFENERGSGFHRNQKSGAIEIYALDGAFDYFDFLSHGETPFPSVYLRLDGRQFADISATHLADYDEEIARVKKRLTPQALDQLRSCKGREALVGDLDNRRSASYVLAVVLAYLYSGREMQSHEYLEKNWPAFEQARTWNLILRTRRKGILHYARKSPSKLAIGTQQ